MDGWEEVGRRWVCRMLMHAVYGKRDTGTTKNQNELHIIFRIVYTIVNIQITCKDCKGTE